MSENSGVLEKKGGADDGEECANEQGSMADEGSVVGGVDSWYSCVVVLGSAVQFIMMGGFYKSFGLLLAALKQQRDYSASQVFAISAMDMACSLLLSPFCGALCRRFSERAVCVVAAITVSLSLTASAFIDSAPLLCLTNGVIFGCAQGFIYVCSVLMVTAYNSKRRSMANAANAASAAIGGSFFPTLVERFLEQHGIQGTYLRIAAISTIPIAAALVFRPLKTEEFNRQVVSDDSCSDSDSCYSAPYDDTVPVFMSGNGAADDKHRITVPDSSSQQTPHYLDSESNSGASQLQPIWSSHPSNNYQQLHNSSEQRTESRGVGRWLVDLLGLDQMRDPLYLLLILGVILFSCGLPHSITFLAQHAIDIGMSRSEAATMISMIAPVDIVTRLSIGALLDRNWFHKRHGLLIISCVGAAGLLTAGLSHSFYSMFTSCCMIFSALGCSFVVMPVVFAEYYGADRLSSTFSLSNFFCGVTSLLAQSASALVRDHTNSFVPVFFAMSAALTGAAFLVLLHAPVQKSAAHGQYMHSLRQKKPTSSPEKRYVC